MKRIILYCLILIGVLVIPVERTDIGSLEPIQAVWMYHEGKELVLETDTEDRGIGQNTDEALADMKHKSSGIVYLDTAEYLLVSESALENIADMKPLLKGSVKVCIWEGEGPLTEAAKYMQSHEIGYRLDKWTDKVKLPKIPPQPKSK